ncbi:alpha-hydroxy acid oxidase [Roseomonas sp. CCTCC AB2023176]|uniref:alpha-hydroxy acid oxidase n=1 Tax=Roseomonas sp. CCTCC AB2023176 TaxID=3342640 RepID=UPI0035DEAC8D
MRQATSIGALRQQARAVLPRLVFDYVDGGAKDEVALAGNVTAFDGLRLVPRVGRDVGVRDTSVTLFGRRWGMPFGVSPTGLANLVRPGADLAIARAAATADVPYILATVASTAIEDAARAVPDHLWFQLYMPADRGVGHDLVRRARDAGAGVLVVTLDVPAPGKRERDLANGFALPFRLGPRTLLDFVLHPAWAMRMARGPTPTFASLAPYAPAGAGSTTLAAFMSRQITADLTWEEVARLRDLWPRPIVAKGVLAPEDVEEAARLGLDGVIVSNHGGRQIGLAAAPVAMLPACVEAARGRLSVMLDSGVRRGEHIAAAKAMGAAMVFAGRPTIYGAAVGGEAGAALALRILRDELDRAMAMLGARDAGELVPGMVRLP